MNAVSRVHGRVSRHMWRPLWPDRPEDEVPITHITNGVHAGPGSGVSALLPERSWQAARSLDAAELWAAHRRDKETLLERVAATKRVELDPDALTIGFARRFATYKRADLLFSDEERVHGLLSDRDRPVQVLLAGKAHPADDAGKRILQRVSTSPASRARPGRSSSSRATTSIWPRCSSAAATSG